MKKIKVTKEKYHIQVGYVLKIKEQKCIIIGRTSVWVGGSMFATKFIICQYKNLKISKKTPKEGDLVFFAVKENCDKAIKVKRIDDIFIVEDGIRTHRIEGDLYYTDKEFEAFVSKKFFLSDSCAYCPVETKGDTVYYCHDNLHYYSEKIYEGYKEQKSINWLGYPSLEEITATISKYKKYVRYFNFEKIISTYKVVKDGWFQCRPGRDDSFNITVTRTIDSSDPYVKSLVPLNEDEDSYACVGRGAGYDDYTILLEGEMKENINNARENYSKDKHLAFLIDKYYKDIFQRKETHDKILYDRERYLLLDDVRKLIDRIPYHKRDDYSFVVEYLNKNIIYQDKINVLEKKISDLNEEVEWWRNIFANGSEEP